MLLESVVWGMLGYSWTIAAATLLTEKLQALALGHFTYLHVPHAITAILQIQKTQSCQCTTRVGLYLVLISF